MAILEALAGGGLGALARLAPEVLKLLDRKNERKHELALGEQALKQMTLVGNQKLEQASMETQSSQLVAALEALKAGLVGQAAPSGVKWIDALASSVRPVITYAFSASYLFYKQQVGWQPEDTAIFSGILNFWFLGRVFDTVLRRRG